MAQDSTPETPLEQLNPHKIGDMLHGFRVTKVTKVPAVHSIAIELIHIKTGAKLVHLLNQDPENLFCIAFKTPPIDDTGVTHIIEHTVLDGSHRFPVKDPFTEMIKTSLATFINALTYSDKTVYPVSSMVKKDFFNLAHIYADAVFRPNLKEMHFYQEAHHLEFEKPDDPSTPLTIKGVVYNEMKGARSDLNGIIARHLSTDATPDTAYGYESGGDPDAIPQLTYDEFLKYYREHYNPSNALIFLYGDIPTSETLEFLDSHYLSHFDPGPAILPISRQPRWDRPRQLEVKYPVNKDVDNSKKSAVTVTFLTNEVTDPITTFAMMVIDYYLLGNDASPLRKALIDSKLGDELTPSGYDNYQREALFPIGLKGVAQSDLDRVVETIFDTLRKISSAGFDKNKLETAFFNIELSTKKIRDNYPIVLMDRIYLSWLYTSDPLGNLFIDDQLKKLHQLYESDPDFFKKVLDQQLLNNQHYIIHKFIPDPDLQERKDQESASKLAAIKESLNPDGIQRILSDTAKMNEFQTSPNSPEDLKTLPRLSLSDVPKKANTLPTKEIEINGTTVLSTDIFSNDVTYFITSFDISDLSDELIDYLPLFADTIGKMGAGDLNYAEIAEEEAASTSGIGASADITGVYGNPQQSLLTLRVYSSTVSPKVARMLELVKLRTLMLDLTDTERLKDVILQLRAYFRSSLIRRGNGFASLRASSYVSKNAQIEERLNGVSQYLFLNNLVNRFNDLSIDINKLEQLKATLLRKSPVISLISPNDISSQVSSFIADFGKEKTQAVLDTSFRPRLNMMEGLSFPSEVAFVAQALPVMGADHPLAPALAVLSLNLSLGYLWEQVRVQGGAYGSSLSYNQFLAIAKFSSFRDPNIASTIKAFQSVPDHIVSKMDLSRSAIDQAIIGSLKSLDYPIRPSHAARLALNRYLVGSSFERRQLYRDRLFNLRKSDFITVAETVIRPALSSASVAVLSGKEKLKKANNELQAKLEVITLP